MRLTDGGHVYSRQEWSEGAARPNMAAALAHTRTTVLLDLAAIVERADEKA